MSWNLWFGERTAMGHCCTQGMGNASNEAAVRGVAPCMPVGGAGGRGVQRGTASCVGGGVKMGKARCPRRPGQSGV